MFLARFTGQIVCSIVSSGSSVFRWRVFGLGTVGRGGVKVRQCYQLLIECNLLRKCEERKERQRGKGERIKQTVREWECSLKIATITYLFDCEKERPFRRLCSCLVFGIRSWGVEACLWHVYINPLFSSYVFLSVCSLLLQQTCLCPFPTKVSAKICNMWKNSLRIERGYEGFFFFNLVNCLGSSLDLKYSTTQLMTTFCLKHFHWT